jgi:uncharacterized protein YukE
MADNNSAEVRFGGDASGASAAAAEAAKAVKEAVGQMQNGLGSLGEAFSSVKGMFAGLTAVLAGGAAFKEAVQETRQMTQETVSLSRILGVAASEASVLNVALDDIRSNGEAYSGAFIHFARQLRNNSDALKQMGVDTDALKNGTKSSNDVFMEALKIVSRYKPGLDQTQAAMTMFGRSVEDVLKLQKLTPQVMEDARRKAEELGLVIGPQGVKTTMEYNAAMNDVGDVMKGVSKAIGDAVMPMLTAMANKFNEIGPVIVKAVRVVMETILGLADLVAWAVTFVTNNWGAMAAGMMAFATGEFSQASTIMKERVSDVAKEIEGLKDVWNGTGNTFLGQYRKTQEESGNADSAAPPAGGNQTYNNPNAKSRMDEWKASLVSKLEADKEYFRNTTEIELQYWEGVRARNNLSIEEKRQVNTMIYELHKKQATDLRGLEVQRIESEKSLDLQELDQKRAMLSMQESMGQISKQTELEQLRIIKEQEYQIELQALQQKLELIKEEGLARQKLLDDVAALKQKHNTEMVKQDMQVFNQIKVTMQNLFSPISTAFSTAVTGIIMGTTTLKQAMANLAQSILMSFVSMGVQLLMNWIATQLAILIFGKTTAKAEGMAQAGAGAAAAMASVAAIPYVGWAMAPAVGEAHFALASAMVMAGASAEGGYDIPAGVNPVVQTHQKEMILPAEQADVIRGMAANGGPGGGMTVNIKAMDSKDVIRSLRTNSALPRALKDMNRRFVR